MVRMIHKKVTLKCNVPEGGYCNLAMKKTTPLTRCRFCVEVSKAAFSCALYNEPLLLESGYAIHKTPSCLMGVDKIV